MNPTFRDVANQYHLTGDDYEIGRKILGSGFRPADKVLCPDGEPYLFRWDLFPHADFASVYFHVQVRSDPERPLHDHPWDNQSVILAGGYMEKIWEGDYNLDGSQRVDMRYRQVGDVITRKAEEAHRLVLPPGIPYTMTLFTCGPKRRKWGFWTPEGWVDADDIIETREGRSVYIGRDNPFQG